MFNEALIIVQKSFFFPKEPKNIRIVTIANEPQTQIDISRFVCKIDGKLYLVSLSTDSSRSSKESASEIRWVLTFRCLKGSRTKLLEILKNPQKLKNTINMYSINQYNDILKVAEKEKRNSQTLCLPVGYYENILQECKAFLSRQEEFKKKSIPWRLGICLYGEPGTGKTSIIHTLASDLNLSISKIKGNYSLAETINYIPDNSILVLEDVDGYISSRENSGGIIDPREKASLSDLLNAIDGLYTKSNGRIIIMTTNKIDKLDPALIRPGRIDILKEVPAIVSKEDANRYIKQNNYNVDIEQVYKDNMSPAQLIGELRRYV